MTKPVLPCQLGKATMNHRECERIKAQVLAWLGAYELPGPAVRIVLALYEFGLLKYSELCEKSGMTAPQLVRNINILKVARLVIVESIPDYVRKQQVALNHKGEATAKRFVRSRNFALAAAINELLPEFREAAVSNLAERLHWPSIVESYHDNWAE